MASPRIMPAIVDALKGWFSGAENCLDFEGSYAVGVVAQAGMILHLDTNGDFALGLGTVSPRMPLVAIQGSHSEDVFDTEASDPAVDKRAVVSIPPDGSILAGALVGSGGYELICPYYTGTADDYLPNTPLTSPTTGGTAGYVTPGTINTHMCLGLVSRGLVSAANSGLGVAYWTDPIYVQ